MQVFAVDILRQMGINTTTFIGQIAGAVALGAAIALAALMVALILSHVVWERAHKLHVVKRKKPPYGWFIRSIAIAVAVLIIAFVLLFFDSNIGAFIG